MKSLAISKSNLSAINDEPSQRPEVPELLDAPAKASQLSKSGQRRLRTETPSHQNPHILLALAAQNEPVDQEYVDIFMKYNGKVATAIYNKDYHAVELLLKHGVDPNAGTLVAAISIKEIRYVELLFKYGANPNVDRANPNSDALTTAVLTNDIRFVELLLQHGADPKMGSHLGCDRNRTYVNTGMSPLEAAVKNKNITIAILLLKSGADPAYPRREEFERLKNGRVRLINKPTNLIGMVLENRDYAMLKAFVQFGANFNTPCFRHGVKPLRAALDMKDTEAVRILLEAGAMS